MYKKKKEQSYYTNRHSCFLLKYHILMVTDRRRPVIEGNVKEIVYRTIKDIMKEKGFTLLELDGDKDYVHICYESDPFSAPGPIINVIKTKTSRFARKEEELLEAESPFWGKSSLVLTEEEGFKEIISEYLQNQE